ncbi:hypothetical protein QE152_g21595 [Popillia japonica]|uniref:Uncharacterized protein n=1 Tax=Popillia japonica TaxID=7064 RepID=A0AAW1KNR1_POPJA
MLISWLIYEGKSLKQYDRLWGRYQWDNGQRSKGEDESALGSHVNFLTTYVTEREDPTITNVGQLAAATTSSIPQKLDGTIAIQEATNVGQLAAATTSSIPQKLDGTIAIQEASRKRKPEVKRKRNAKPKKPKRTPKKKM